MPSRSLFARGSRGGIIRRIQSGLSDPGFYTGTLDGLFGGGTERAILQSQTALGLDPTGRMDLDTWAGVMKTDIPPLYERCLQLTAAMEGHGFGMIQGNWDDAWLTWGIIGFTLRHGELSAIVLETMRTNPDVVRQCFGAATDELIAKMNASPAEQKQWANQISVPPKNFSVVEPWRSAFARFGDQDVVQGIQIRRARDRYFAPGLETAKRFGLKTELGVALCFDIHVQNGGIGDETRAAIEAAAGAQPPPNERSTRIVIANAVADHALERFREDVRSRKLTIATGAGTVHGESFVLESWALGEFV